MRESESAIARASGVPWRASSRLPAASRSGNTGGLRPEMWPTSRVGALDARRGGRCVISMKKLYSCVIKIISDEIGNWQDAPGLTSNDAARARRCETDRQDDATARRASIRPAPARSHPPAPSPTAAHTFHARGPIRHAGPIRSDSAAAWVRMNPERMRERTPAAFSAHATHTSAAQQASRPPPYESMPLRSAHRRRRRRPLRPCIAAS